MNINALATGTRIRLLHMPDDPAPIPDGATGTVYSVTRWPGFQDNIGVDWDAPHDKRSLSLCVPPDTFEVLP